MRPAASHDVAQLGLAPDAAGAVALQRGCQRLGGAAQALLGLGRPTSAAGSARRAAGCAGSRARSPCAASCAGSPAPGAAPAAPCSRRASRSARSSCSARCRSTSSRCWSCERDTCSRSASAVACTAARSADSAAWAACSAAPQLAERDLVARLDQRGVGIRRWRAASGEHLPATPPSTTPSSKPRNNAMKSMCPVWQRPQTFSGYRNSMAAWTS